MNAPLIATLVGKIMKATPGGTTAGEQDDAYDDSDAIPVSRALELIRVGAGDDGSPNGWPHL